MFMIPARRTIRQRLAHTTRRAALAAASRVLAHLDTPATTPAAAVTPAPAAETSPAAPLFTAADLPPVEVIAAAAAEFDQAADAARAAERAKRKARKLLDRLPVGPYGDWMVSRVPSAKQTPDLDQIRAIFARHGLGEIPMRPCAPTLKVTLAPAADVQADAVEVLAVAA